MCFAGENDARIGIQKWHLQARRTSIDGYTATKQLSMCFPGQNDARISIQKWYLEDHRIVTLT